MFEGLDATQHQIALSLVPIFPQLTASVIKQSVTHPSNWNPSSDVQLQLCIDDLLDLRTYSQSTAAQDTLPAPVSGLNVDVVDGCPTSGNDLHAADGVSVKDDRRGLEEYQLRDAILASVVADTSSNVKDATTHDKWEELRKTQSRLEKEFEEAFAIAKERRSSSSETGHSHDTSHPVTFLEYTPKKELKLTSGNPHQLGSGLANSPKSLTSANGTYTPRKRLKLTPSKSCPGGPVSSAKKPNTPAEVLPRAASFSTQERDSDLTHFHNTHFHNDSSDRNASYTGPTLSSPPEIQRTVAPVNQPDLILPLKPVPYSEQMLISVGPDKSELPHPLPLGQSSPSSVQATCTSISHISDAPSSRTSELQTPPLSPAGHHDQGLSDHVQPPRLSSPAPDSDENLDIAALWDDSESLPDLQPPPLLDLTDSDIEESFTQDLELQHLLIDSDPETTSDAVLSIPSHSGPSASDSARPDPSLTSLKLPSAAESEEPADKEKSSISVSSPGQDRVSTSSVSPGIGSYPNIDGKQASNAATGDLTIPSISAQNKHSLIKYAQPQLNGLKPMETNKCNQSHKTLSGMPSHKDVALWDSESPITGRPSDDIENPNNAVESSTSHVKSSNNGGETGSVDPSLLVLGSRPEEQVTSALSLLAGPDLPQLKNQVPASTNTSAGQVLPVSETDTNPSDSTDPLGLRPPSAVAVTPETDINMGPRKEPQKSQTRTNTAAENLLKAELQKLAAQMASLSDAFVYGSVASPTTTSSAGGSMARPVAESLLKGSGATAVRPPASVAIRPAVTSTSWNSVAVVRPPVVGSSRNPAATLTKPSGTVARPPAATVTRPPTVTGTRVTAATVSKSPAATITRPPAANVARPPAVNIHRPLGATLVRSSAATVTRPPAAAETVPRNLAVVTRNPAGAVTISPATTLHGSPASALNRPPTFTGSRPAAANTAPAAAATRPPAPMVTRPPIATVTRPPAPMVTRPPAATVTRPPAATFTRPPAATISRPPTAASARPPAAAVARPPAAPVSRPPAATVTRPPAATVTRPPAATVTRPPAATVTRPPAATVTKPPAATVTKASVATPNAAPALPAIPPPGQLPKPATPPGQLEPIVIPDRDPVIVPQGQAIVIGDEGQQAGPSNPQPQESRVTGMMDEVRILISDVETEYLRGLCERFQNDANGLDKICNFLFENADYPRYKPPAPSKPAAPAKVEEVSIDYYNDYKTNMNYETRQQVITLLQNDFKQIPVSDLRRFAAIFNGHYAPTHKCFSDNLKNAGISIKNGELSANSGTVKRQVKMESSSGIFYARNITLLRCGRKKNLPCKITDPCLRAEYNFVCGQLNKEIEVADQQLASQLNENEYEESGQLIECGCCYGEHPFESMVQCYEGHLFCVECLHRYAKEAVYGQGKVTLSCLDGECDSTFPKSQLQRALPESVYLKYEERCKEEDLNLAGLDDLVRCPHCDFAALLDPGDKVFKCQNPECMKETCRHCQEDWAEHFGIPCKEMEKKDETKLRTSYEEKMSQAKIRTCHRCKTGFMKSDGCNKMTCRCGARMCYICRLPDIDYNHFCRHLREPGKNCTVCKACSLWTNPEQDDERAVAEIQKEAQEARVQQGFTEDRTIGATDPPVAKKPRLT